MDQAVKELPYIMNTKIDFDTKIQKIDVQIAKLAMLKKTILNNIETI